jgi:hypothetical protein
MPTHSQIAGTGLWVASARNGNGKVRAVYRLRSVRRIKGDRWKTDGDVALTPSGGDAIPGSSGEGADEKCVDIVHLTQLTIHHS